MEKNTTVLVTGATGYIGSHTVCDLLSKNYKVILLDNTENSTEKVIPQIAKIVNKPVNDLPFYNVDIRQLTEVERVFEDCEAKGNKIDAVIHFAALKAAGESVKYPLDYYDTNMMGTLNVLKAMQKFKCCKIIFSSSACVYGNGNKMCKEDDPTTTLNPYGSTKLFAEKMIEEFCNSETGIINLYMNTNIYNRFLEKLYISTQN
jgi:UDP-glucose 4-epimerase